MLGNLYDFQPEQDAVPFESMPDIDRFALHGLCGLIQTARKAYKTYEFHIIYHALYNFCTIDLSAFYLDILKDRLYTFSPKSVQRRSAQTVMHKLLDSNTRIMAPIMPFTSEEIWKHVPGNPESEESVHLVMLPEANEEWRDEELSSGWEQILSVRGEVTKALEEARVKKLIGHPLDAEVDIEIKGKIYDLLSSYAAELRSIFIVSSVRLFQEGLSGDIFESTAIKGMKILVKSALHRKCERCWIYDSSVGKSDEHPTVCARCRDALSELEPED